MLEEILEVELKGGRELGFQLGDAAAVQNLGQADAFGETDADARRSLGVEALGGVVVGQQLYEVGGSARVDRLGFDVAVYDGTLESDAWTVRRGRMPEAAGEGAISTALADTMGATVGQSLTLDVSNDGWLVLDALRKKRNANDYLGDLIERESMFECIRQADSLLARTRKWLAEHRPDLMDGGKRP